MMFVRSCSGFEVGYVAWEKLSAWLVRHRVPFILAFTVLLNAVSYLAAFGLRFDFDLDVMAAHSPEIWLPLSLLLFFRMAANIYWRLNSGFWRYASTHDLVAIVKAKSVSTLALMTTVGFLRLPFPRALFFIELALAILFSGGVRLLLRLAREQFFTAQLNGGGAREVVILGGGDSGHLLVKHLKGHARFRYRPVAVLDDSDHLQGGSLNGVPIAGKLSYLKACLEERPHVAAVILAIPSLSPARIRAIQQVCRELNVPLKRVQAFEDIACRDIDEELPALSIEAVLEKEVQIEHETEIREALCGKRILVTGGGGSIGSEIVRQVLRFDPEEVVILDHSEYNVFRFGQELAAQQPAVKVRTLIANICHEARLLKIVDEIRPQIVFHAAAYKHVPLMEENPHEALENNIVGTRNVLRAAHLCGAERFVFISSDKAVDPSSVMGASKRIAEMLIQEYAREQEPPAGPPRTSASIVRFGNVINSAGSVIPTFKEQILSGGPITITHPDMERYFMSIREAVRLVLISGILGDHGEIYILDMGKPIKIVDVARKMRALYGRRDIPLQFIGLRPGEKLREQLTSANETRAKTRFNKVSKVVERRPAPHRISEWLRYLHGRAQGISSAMLAELIHECAHADLSPASAAAETVALGEG